VHQRERPALSAGERGPEGERRFPDGIWFVNLAPLSDPGLVAATIAQTFSLRAVGGQPIQEVLKSYLRVKRLLLLLDNFEQVVDAAPLIGELLAAAPGLRVLITSRMPLHLSGEREYAVPPLGLPPATDRQRPNPETISQYEAVRLFIERAQAVKADFAVTNDNAPAVAGICARLDGLPLAIELAAVRIKLFPPQTLLTRLDNRLKLLTGGARDLPHRQQTIRNTIDWSYHLLDAGEQTLFVRLGVFVGGCTIEAAEAVCNADGELPMEVVDGIAALVDKSLLRQDEGVSGEPRFTMLETIREYALERLAASGTEQIIREQHAKCYLALAEAAEPELLGSKQEVWLNRLAAEHDNLLATFQWTIAQGEVETALRLSAALWRFWDTRGPLSEGRQWLAVALEQGESLPTAIRAKALNGAGYLAAQSDRSAARIFFEDSLRINQALGDKQSIALSLLGLGNVASDERQAIANYEESLALYRELDDTSGIAWSLTRLADIALSQSDYGQSIAHSTEALRLYRALDDKGGIAWMLHHLGEIAGRQGDYQRAVKLVQESLGLYQKLGDQGGIAWSLGSLGNVALAQGHDNEAMAYYERSLAIFLEYGHKANVTWMLTCMGECERLQGDYVRAAAFYGQSLTVSREAGDQVSVAVVLHNLGHVALHQGDNQQAVTHFRESLALSCEVNHKPSIILALAGLAGVAGVQGQLERAALLFGAVGMLLTEIGLELERIDRVEHDRNLAAIRAQLDEATFAAAWEVGQAMTLERAIAEALGEAP
jgi:predicted ATPase